MNQLSLSFFWGNLFSNKPMLRLGSMLWQCRSNPHLHGGCPVAGMDHPKHTPGCCLSIHPVEPLRQVKSSGTFHLTLEQAAGWISPLAASGNLRWSPRSWHQSWNSLFHLLPWKSACFCRNCSLAEYPPSGQIIYLLPVVPHKAVAEVSKIGNL